MMPADDCFVMNHEGRIRSLEAQLFGRAVSNDEAYAKGWQDCLAHIRKSLAAEADQPIPRVDPEPQPTDGPDYHAEHAAWAAR